MKIIIETDNKNIDPHAIINSLIRKYEIYFSDTSDYPENVKILIRKEHNACVNEKHHKNC